MEYLYAQLDNEGICMGLSQLAAKVETANMVRLTLEQYQNCELMGMRYAEGTWEATAAETGL